MVLNGYWPLNESSGSTAYDHSGKENHGTINGTPSKGVNGVVGENAFDFDPDDYVDLGAPDSLQPDYISISGWFKISDTQGPLVTRTTGGFNSDNSYTLYYRDGKTINFGVYIGSTDDDFITAGASNIELSKWNFFTGTFDGSEVKIYVNGELRSSTSANGTVQKNSTNTYIAARDDFAVKPDFTGTGIRIYNRAITFSEVQYLYTASQGCRQVTSRKYS